ncbi:MULTISPECIES: hypothetical protein [Burkholderia]|uniref:hypothetical protein n=1 Tax=Burkholderia TaxID=32008 RepID=UPI0011786093|nr:MULTISPECIES: hypothetical protein [Burkholderia]EKS9798638.1 hypothetical protein [Burkholderia cepacia]EKS9802336.1 hypothetical protein [Burkholderia cepacia]EKS9809650.1 hypothetical protein [Burkholderia cepacia]EKS9822277.1 hypothetical protein [Burkholderia cepacia]EKS9824220.1 hypothetical protein [Burkholderia cepacia]
MRMEYFRSMTEFPCGSGWIYTEFIDGVATRQISHPQGGVLYASSSVGDWNPEIGFLLFDGVKEELEISPNDEIKREDFECVWKMATANP